MAITGKNSLTLRKRDLENEKTIAVGFTKLQAWHKATAGETGIDLLALNFPSEITGAVNPSNTKLAKAQLRKYAANVTVTSSLNGKLMRELSYTIPNATRINWVGFTAAQDEIFEITVDYSASTELTLVDGKPLVVTGTLAAGQTDIVVGQPFEAGKFIDQQTGAVQVYIDGVQQFRNTNNLASPADGNYYELNVGGVSNLIRMNSVSGSDRSYLVMSNGVIAERPTVSQQADIERVQGQIDAMIPDLAQAAGTLETDYQAAPNNIDLKTFGDRVINLEKIFNTEIEIIKVAYLKDLRANGVAGQALAVGANGNEREVNTIEGDGTFVTLTNGTTGVGGTATRFILEPGTYRIDALTQSVRTNDNALELYNHTDSTPTITYQTNVWSDSVDADGYTPAHLKGTFTIGALKEFSIRHRVQTANSGGNPVVFGQPEVYMVIELEKIENKTISEWLGL